MARVKFLLPFALLLFFIGFLNTHQPFGLSVPPLGPLLSPFSGFWTLAEPKVPVKDETWLLEGVEDEVTVVFDERLVPHIYAQKVTDAAFAQGYVTAAFRLWQMDITVRGTAGRLSEVLGDVTLENDKRQRRLGFTRDAHLMVDAWKSSPEELQVVDAYARGVNAYLRQLDRADWPIEFKLLDYAPEEWSPWHSAVVVKSMAQTLCMRHDDVEASNSLRLLGPEEFQFLFPERNSRQSPVIPEEVEWMFDPLPLPETETHAEKDLLSYDHKLFPLPPPFMGSNNWALAGSRTASGAPMLANDPHLNLTLPSIWYEVQIYTPEYEACGVSLPGLPGVVIGFNQQVAWGVTNVSQDVLDWYRIEWVDDNRTTYRLDGKEISVSYARDTIRVRGEDPIIEETKMTRWGPVVYTDSAHSHKDLAMHWLAAEKAPEQSFYELGAFLRLGRAKNHADYQEALKGYGAPAQNFVFASRDGDIALQVNGRFPLKAEGQGKFVQNGNRSAQAWAGYIPMDQVPQAKNPPRGFVASANQRSTGADYPYYYNGFFDDYRGRYINRVLEQAEGWTPQDMMALQQDSRSLFPEELLPLMLEKLPRSGLSDTARQAVNLLEDWDYTFEAGKAAPVLFQEWYRHFYHMTFDELLAASEEKALLFPEKWRLIELADSFPTHRIFDQADSPEREDVALILKKSLSRMLVDYGESLLKGELQWSDYNNLQIRHLARIQAFSSDRIFSGGYRDAPNAINGSNGPSWRMVVDLSEPMQAWGVFPGGQSGNPGSYFYDNNIEVWAQGDYHPLVRAEMPEALQSLATWTFLEKDK